MTAFLCVLNCSIWLWGWMIRSTETREVKREVLCDDDPRMLAEWDQNHTGKSSSTPQWKPRLSLQRSSGWQKSRWERVSNTGGSYIEECSWFALWWVRPDVSAGDREIYSLRRLSSSAVVWLSVKAIYPHTWIRNEIIIPPPRALITQPWWLDGPSPIERVRIWIEKRRSWQAGTI